jgi:cytochrome P450
MDRGRVADYDKRDESQRVTRELAAYFTRLIAAKRAEPGNDLLSALVRARDKAEEEGAEHGLTSTELLSTAFQLVMAGFDTTVNLIASGTLALLTHPEEMARLREDPSLFSAAVEELLRFTNPVNHAAWALPWPAWWPRSPSAPCSPASRENRSRSPRRNSAGVPSAL